MKKIKQILKKDVIAATMSVIALILLVTVLVTAFFTLQVFLYSQENKNKTIFLKKCQNGHKISKCEFYYEKLYNN